MFLYTNFYPYLLDKRRLKEIKNSNVKKSCFISCVRLFAQRVFSGDTVKHISIRLKNHIYPQYVYLYACFFFLYIAFDSGHVWATTSGVRYEAPSARQRVFFGIKNGKKKEKFSVLTKVSLDRRRDAPTELELRAIWNSSFGINAEELVLVPSYSCTLVLVHLPGVLDFWWSSSYFKDVY